MTTSTAISTSGGLVPKLLACGAGVAAAAITKNPVFASPCLLLLPRCGGDDPTKKAEPQPQPEQKCSAKCENTRVEYSAPQTLPADGRIIEVPGGYLILRWDKIQKLDCAGQIKWEKDLTGLDIYAIHGLSPTKDGGVVIAALSQNRDDGLLLIKLDNNGNMQWRKKGLGFDSVALISQTSDGGYFFVNNENLRFFISKLDSYGQQAGPQRAFYNEIHAMSSFVDASNHAETIVAGSAGWPLWMARVNQMTGDVLEGDGNQRTIDTGIDGYLNVRQIVRTGDGNYVVLGDRSPSNLDVPQPLDHFFVVRTDSAFSPIWERAGRISYRLPYNANFPKSFLSESGGSIHVGRLEEEYDGTTYVGHREALITSFGPDGSAIGNDAAVMANEGWLFSSFALFGGSIVYTQTLRGENPTSASFHRVCLP